MEVASSPPMLVRDVKAEDIALSWREKAGITGSDPDSVSHFFA